MGRCWLLRDMGVIMAYSKVGFLASGGGGNPTGIGNYVNSLHNAGIPAVVMCNDGMVGISDALATGGNHVMLYRIVKDNTEQWSVPDYGLSPAAAAQKHWDKLRPEFHPDFTANKSKIWLQPINEVDKNRSDWLGNFGVEFAKIANGQGYRVAMFAFSSGEPEPAHWRTAGMLNYLRYCAANKEMAAVALHEYDYGHAGMQSTYPWHIGRFEELFRACDENGIARPYILISEFGWSYDDIPPQQQVMNDIDYAANLYAKYRDVLGAAIWYLGPGFSNIANKVQQLITPVTEHTLNTTYPDPPDNPTPPPSQNLLPNPSFEEGHYNQDGIPELQFPNKWQWTWKTDSGYVRPEFRVQPRNQIPEAERPLYFVPPPPDDSSWNTLKAFKQGLPIRPTLKLLEALDLPAGKYRFSFWVYPDVYTAVVNGVKQWSNDPAACQIRLFWNGVQGNWQSLHPYGGTSPRLITYEWQHTGGDAIVGFQADFPLKEVPGVSTIHNGLFTDAHDLHLIEDEPMTWQEQAAQIADDTQALFYKAGASLQTIPTGHGFQVFGNEFDFLRPDGVKIRIRGAIHPTTAVRRYYWCPIPEWSNVSWYELDGGTSEPDSPFSYGR